VGRRECLADHVLSQVHIVNFDENQKINQIRIYWDQGSILKQLDVIGARGRNWPVRDGKEMARLIANSVAAAPLDQPSNIVPDSPPKTGAQDMNLNSLPHRASVSSQRSSVSAAGDPHARLFLSESQTVEEEETTHYANSIAPRVSKKPPSRDLNDILSPEKEDKYASVRSQSPMKSGAGKNYRPNRLFEEEANDPTPTASPEKPSVKTNPKKYNHFEFGDGEDAVQRPTSSRAKHQSQWDFVDFVTPQKGPGKVRGQDARHFGWSDDEVGQGSRDDVIVDDSKHLQQETNLIINLQDEESPVRRPIVHKPRPDAKPHFEFADDGTPQAEKAQPKPNAVNKGLSLYKNHISGDGSDDTPVAKKPLSNVNVNNRGKDFGAHWEMRDEYSPSVNKTQDNKNAIAEDRKKVISGMNPGWSMYDESSEQSKKENMPGERGIKTAGNGMGGRKDAVRHWGFEDEEKTEPQDSIRGRSQEQKQKTSGFWDF
jgi:hypothetical protein